MLWGGRNRRQFVLAVERDLAGETLGIIFAAEHAQFDIVVVASIGQEASMAQCFDRR